MWLDRALPVSDLPSFIQQCLIYYFSDRAYHVSPETPPPELQFDIFMRLGMFQSHQPVPAFASIFQHDEIDLKMDACGENYPI
jgi:hypothetical protein